jgi:hypothetical protein
MRLANRVLLCVLAIFILSAGASAQLSENDPRNLSPSVGTGGPPGGPTGLFTVFDGRTLRRGEYTFSIAYSNYDRDPGNVDITDVPISFNVGLNNHIELFFKTNAYRGIKVNSPTMLSSFYLPNSQGYFTALGLGSMPAIILAPSGPTVGTLAGTAVFRPPFFPPGNGDPTFNNYYRAGQPFVQFPFIGGVGPNFSVGPGVIGGLFGFPGFATAINTPIIGSGGNFGAASTFPGMGSVVGSILPGIVLATATLPCTALTGNCRPPGSPGPLNPIVVPVSFTIAPTYLPDAPFVNRLYGQSSFTDFVVGAKIRLTSQHNPLGFGFIPFYRRWMDNANDATGFNQLQRGAGPGGNIGDFGLTAFIDGRLSKHVNLSVNSTYILNSNPKSSAMNDAVLLDRPDEWDNRIGVDFPINKHFQPIAELGSIRYVAGRTPNAFQNNPVEFLAGIKIYPKRWFGFGAWYRRHLNQQSLDRFNPVDFNTTIAQTTGVFVPGRGIIIVPGTSRPATSGGIPLGFVPSDDPHGFGFQFFAGHRRARVPAILPNQPPVISSFSASNSRILLPCREGYHSTSNQCPAPNTSVGLTTSASDPDGDTLLYTYTVTGGRITGEGPNVTWDLSGLGPGTYTASVDVDDGCGCITTSSTSVTIAECPDCVPNYACPTAINTSCPDSVDPGNPITFTATVAGSPAPPPSGYNWSVSAGTITSGQGTSSITVSTTGLGGGSVTATVDVTGLDPSCPHTASCTTSIKPPPALARKFDEYGNIRFNDEKARLDNFAIQLQNEPTSQGEIIGYGACGSEGIERANRAKDYLVNTRGIDASRLIVVDGGCKPELKVELWIVPQGATQQAADTSGAVSPCPDCKKKATRPHRGRRRGEE